MTLTKNEINRLCSLLRDSAQDKKRRARQAHENDRTEMISSAMNDYELRKKLIAMKLDDRCRCGVYPGCDLRTDARPNR